MVLHILTTVEYVMMIRLMITKLAPKIVMVSVGEQLIMMIVFTVLVATPAWYHVLRTAIMIGAVVHILTTVLNVLAVILTNQPVFRIVTTSGGEPQ